jgi:hypothetical protein
MSDIRSIGSSKDRIRLIFDAARLSSRAMSIAENKARNIATNYVRTLRKHIREQDYVWPALNPDYLEYKRRHGLDERMWIATGKLYNQIRVSKGVSTKTGRVGYFGGIRKDAIHHYDAHGDPVYTWWIMMALEYGNMRRGIPPRPLFEPALRETLERERKRYAP